MVSASLAATDDMAGMISRRICKLVRNSDFEPDVDIWEPFAGQDGW
jgi:hypothetical protein